MREIKFRAWHRLEREMIFVYVLDQTGRADTGYNADESKGYSDAGQKRFYLHDVELMQYSGLKDKNGKEIYEGDIVKRSPYSIKCVTWKSGKGGFTGWNICDGRYGNKTLEIIGNIYENPELLNQTP